MKQIKILTAIILSLSVTFLVVAQARELAFAPDQVLVKLKTEHTIYDSEAGRIPTIALEEKWISYGITSWDKIAPRSSNGSLRWFKLEISPNIEIEDVLNYLMEQPEVEIAHPNYCEYPDDIPNDPDYGRQWYWPIIESDPAWDITHGSEDIVIAIIDSGTSLTHPDLIGSIWMNSEEPINGIDDDLNGYIDDYQGWDFVGNDNNPDNVNPVNDHGTHVAGIAGAMTNNGIGAAGASWGCPLMICKVFSDNGGSAFVDDVAEAIYYATDMGASIINLSLGNNFGPEIERDAVYYAYSNNVAVFAAAGNGGADGLGDPEEHYPAAFEGAIAVGNSNKNEKKNDSSNYGPWVDFYAPGTKIYSTIPPTAEKSYDSFTGTSMSSPLSAGYAGLLLSADPTLTPDQLVDRIKAGCDNFDKNNPLFRGNLSAGRINFFNSLIDTARVKTHHLVIDDPEGNDNNSADSGETITLNLFLQNHSWMQGDPVSVVISLVSGDAEIVDGSADYGPIPSKDIKKNADLLQMQVSPEAENEIVIAVNITSGAYIESESITIPVNIPAPQLPTFPKTTTDSFNASPKVADLNNDGKLEIISVSNEGLLHVFQTDGSYLPGFPVLLRSDQPIDDYLVLSAPAVSDMNLDGFPEIIVASYEFDYEYINPSDPEQGKQYRTIGLIDAIQNNGTELTGFPKKYFGEWTPEMDERVSYTDIKCSPVVVDIVGDEHPEIVFGTYGNEAYLIDADGINLPGWPIDLGTDIFATAAVADLDNDGQQDIIIATKADTEPLTSGAIYRFSPDGTIYPGYPVDATNQVYSAPVIVDLDGDQNLEIIFGFGDYANETDNHGLLALHQDGSIVDGFPFLSAATVYGSPALGDLNGDSLIDIVFADFSGSVYAVNSSGQAAPGFPVNLAPDSPFNASPCIAELDNEGGPEIIISNQNKNLYILKNDGTQMSYSPLTMDGDGFPSQAIEDLDNDGDLEIVAHASSVYVFNLSGAYNADMQYWPSFHGNNSNDGFLDFETSPITSGVDLQLNMESFTENDPFVLDCWVNNASLDTVEDLDLFVILEVAGLYYYYPNWTDTVDWQNLDELLPGKEFKSIFDFTWPAGDFGTFSGINFYGGLVTPDIQLFGDYDVVSFGFY